MIASRERIQAAVQRARALDPDADRERSIEVAAQSLGVPVELVREALAQPEEASPA